MGRYALVLGTATCHSDRSIADLPAVRHDVSQIKAVLDHAGGFDSVDAYLDEDRSTMARRIETFYGARRHGDFALLYYSGHGLLHHDRESLFLAATDTEQERLHATAIDTSAVLKDMLSRTYAAQKVVILDCCFSGAFAAGNRFRGGMREEPRGGLRHSGTFILTSSTHSRASFAQGNDRPSVFTERLLEGLRGSAVPRDGSTWITTHDLSHFVQAAAAGRAGPCESSDGVTEPIPIVATQPSVGDGRRREPGRAADPDGPDTPFDADRWRKVLRYYIACISRSAMLQAFVDLADRDRYEPMPEGAEPVFAANTAPRLEGRLADLAKRTAAAGGELRYGYPVVVRRAPSGRQPIQFAPVLECDATVGADGVLHTTLPPRVNAALVAERGLSDKEVDDLNTQIEETFVAGDATTVAATVRLLIEVLDVAPAVPLDPADLAGTLRSGPLRRTQNCAVLFAVDAANSAESQLLEDLKDIAKNPGRIADTALGALVQGNTSQARTPDTSAIVALDLLNEGQEQVIRAAMTDRLTVAQGPPGTGKTQLVTALVATATAAGQTVLVGSTNNRAVSEVSDRCDELVGPGLIVRSGNKQYLSQEPKLLTELITTHTAGAPADTATPAGDLRVLQRSVDQARSALDERALLERDLAELAVERQESGPADSLPTDERALHRLVRRADRGLQHRVLGWWSRRKLRAFGVADRHGLQAFALRATVELRWQHASRMIAAAPDEREVWSQLRQLTTQDRPRLGRDLITAQVATRVRRGAVVLQRRCEELSQSRPRTWSRFGDLLKVLPAWAVTALSVRKIPPTPALFDLVVIDEAAACIIPAVLPMLFRAKRALIIGDPRQLAPVVPLPGDEDRQYRTEAGIGTEWLDSRRLIFTSHSAYDAFAAGVSSVHLLEEHYRCHPQIIAAPNREVYQDRLIVLTPTHKLNPQVDSAVVWRHVPGRYTRGSSGSGYNTAEIDAVVAEVISLRTQHPDATLGVVTPLAAQAARLRRALDTAGITEDVACGTAHRFQGGQRDIIVLSPAGAHGIADTTRNWLISQTNLWNVAITRAKAMLVIVGDKSWWAGQHGILAGLTGDGNTEHHADPSLLPAADALQQAAREAGLTVRRDAVIAAHRYDLVMPGRTGDIAVLIDLPSTTGNGRRLRTALSRIDAAGRELHAERVPVWRCLAEPAAAIAALQQRSRDHLQAI